MNNSFPTLRKCTSLNKLSELPESISINHVGSASAVEEDKEFQLQCNITNVAPVRNLAVLWYQDNKIFNPENKGEVKLLPETCPNMQVKQQWMSVE